MLTPIEIQPQKNEIYLDNNATTPVLPQAAEAAMHAMQLCYGNPSSSHMTGIKAKYILESTRKLVRQVIGAANGDVIFTSGATEGIQTAIISALNAARHKGIKQENPILLYGATEHKAVPETLKHWNEMLNIGAEVVAIPVDENGLLDFEFIAKHISDALMICTMAVNNETGVFQDLKALETTIRQGNADVLWMVDSVQALGKVNLTLSETTIDYAPFSGHKLYALKGIGVLYIRENAPYTAVIAGGGQESGLRSGTENLPGIASLNAIFRLLADENDNTFKSHQLLVDYRQQLADTIKTVFPEAVFNHDFKYSVPTTLNFSVKNLAAKDVMDLFDAARIRVSSGSACSSKVTGSFVLDAMGKQKWQSEAAIRLSFGPAITQQEIDSACNAIIQAGNALKHSCLLLADTEEIGGQGVDGLQQWIFDQQCTWCYVDNTTKECFLIDVLPEFVTKFETLVKCQGYVVKGVFETHSHQLADKCSAMLREIVDCTGDNYDSAGWPSSNVLTVTLENGAIAEAISIGSKVLARLPTPGHTDNSFAYLLGTTQSDKLSKNNIDYAFVGDTIQIGGLGRTDFANSDSEQMYTSVVTLSEVITEQTLICPGHDYQQLFTTTLALEAQSNELLSGILNHTVKLHEFTESKRALDTQLNSSSIAGFCGEIKFSRDAGFDIEPENFCEFLSSHPDAIVLDVREPHEHEAHSEHYIQQQKLVNLPLTQLVNFINSGQYNKQEQCFICICRSGNRSGAAAKTLTRMGYKQVFHVPGGFALLD